MIPLLTRIRLRAFELIDFGLPLLDVDPCGPAEIVPARKLEPLFRFRSFVSIFACPGYVRSSAKLPELAELEIARVREWAEEQQDEFVFAFLIPLDAETN